MSYVVRLLCPIIHLHPPSRQTCPPRYTLQHTNHPLPRRHPTLYQTDNDISLEWDGVTDVGSTSLTAYRVFQDDGTVESTWDTPSGDQLFLWRSGLTAGKVYRFAVSAVNAAGPGPRSERVTLIASDKPGPPTWYSGLDSIVSQAPTALHIKWKAPTMTGVAGISGYAIPFALSSHQESSPVMISSHIEPQTTALVESPCNFICILFAVLQQGCCVLLLYMSCQCPRAVASQETVVQDLSLPC